jgi:hypothetical protein
MLSSQASNAIMYVTYGVVFFSALAVAYYVRDTKTFLSANRSQKGIALGFNFVASGML